MRVAEPELSNGIEAPCIVVRGTWQQHMLTFLMVFGPGLIIL